jgi:EGF domain-specific O-GlcNAc transferase
MLSRKTKYRNVLNEDELFKKIAKNTYYQVQRVTYDHRMMFSKQLEITRNSDIFIGIHGAGLTHLLFLPKWATIFELYNCEDPNCYKDLARLRGVNYITWEDDSKLEAIDAGYGDDKHQKFKNYKFDVDEFERLVEKAAENVRNHQNFVKAKEEVKHEEL